MPVLIHEEHLLSLFTSLGLSRESLSDYAHGDLVGMALALLEYEAMAAYDPEADHTHSFKGFGNGLMTIAASSPTIDPERSTGLKAGIVSVRLAEHALARIIEQITVLDNEEAKEVPFIPPVLHNLFAAGCLISLMNTTGEPAEFRRVIREAQEHMTASRKGVADAKRALRKHNIAV